jgi:TPP-dependent pyruvate/acetoin dehydrogenase alpha subunit
VSEITDMEAGPQPIDALMTEAEMRNHDLVAACSETLTHKQVAKARRGRKLTRRLQERVQKAWNAARKEDRPLAELFNYKGR